MDEARGVRFDDLEALQALVSEEFGPFGPPIEITQEMIDAFGKLTMDEQWIHSDVARAEKESPYGTTIAHGFLLVSLISALKGGDDTPLVGMGSVINYGADKLRFTGAVPAGSSIHARRRIVHVRKKGPGTQLTVESQVHVVGEDKPAMVYRSLVLFMP